jgi:CDP-diglyceride synthetase
MSEKYHYKGHRAGAIASGFFVAGVSFLILAALTIFFVVAPEGAPRNIPQDNRLLAVCLAACAILSALFGWKTKSFFDRRAGRG